MDISSKEDQHSPMKLIVLLAIITFNYREYGKIIDKIKMKHLDTGHPIIKKKTKQSHSFVHVNLLYY